MLRPSPTSGVTVEDKTHRLVVYVVASGLIQSH
jgi:hypothetical protein